MVNKEIKAQLLDLIRKSREQELLFLRTIRDAAILAGEQVQDKRLDLLENPPDVDSGSFLMDFLIALALGPGASLAIKAFTTRGMRAILRNRGLEFDENDQIILSVEKTLYLPEGLARNLLDERKKEFELWTKVAKGIEQVGEVGVDVAAKRIQSADTAKGTKPLTGDTASVAVRRAALSFVRLQEPVVVLVHEHYKDIVESGEFDFTPKIFIKFLENNIKFPEAIKTKTNSELEQSLSLFFEACIWLLHFSESGGINEQLIETETAIVATDTDLRGLPRNTVLRTVTRLSSKRPIVSYWIRRFPHPDGDGRESFLQYFVNKNKGKKATEDVFFEEVFLAISDLQDWFANIEKGIVSLQQLGVVGLEVLGPAKPK
jgi:hypothetical protein